MKKGGWLLAIVLPVLLTGCLEEICSEEEIAQIDAHSLYKKNCATCHGEQMQGNIGPSLQEVGSHYSREELAEIITKGRPGMPSFETRLDERQLNRLLNVLGSE